MHTQRLSSSLPKAAHSDAERTKRSGICSIASTFGRRSSLRQQGIECALILFGTTKVGALTRTYLRPGVKPTLFFRDFLERLFRWGVVPFWSSMFRQQ
jgi:hypothetical protein